MKSIFCITLLILLQSTYSNGQGPHITAHFAITTHQLTEASIRDCSANNSPANEEIRKAEQLSASLRQITAKHGGGVPSVTQVKIDIKEYRTLIESIEKKDPGYANVIRFKEGHNYIISTLKRLYGSSKNSRYYDLKEFDTDVKFKYNTSDESRYYLLDAISELNEAAITDCNAKYSPAKEEIRRTEQIAKSLAAILLSKKKKKDWKIKDSKVRLQLNADIIKFGKLNQLIKEKDSSYYIRRFIEAEKTILHLMSITDLK